MDKRIRLASTEPIDSEGGAPERIKILDTGKIFKYGVEITFRKKDLVSIVRNFKKMAIGHKVPVNYSPHGDGKAAGWIKELELEGNDLMADLQWNQKGRESVENKEYIYHSVGVHMDYPSPKENKGMGPALYELTLTNSPANANIEALVELEKESQEDEIMTEKEKLELEKDRKDIESKRVELEKAREEVEAAKKELLATKLELSRERRELELGPLVEAKKITPAQRDAALKLSNDAYEGFKLAIPEKALDINTAPKGKVDTSGVELTSASVQEEIHRLAVEIEEKEKIDYGEAVLQVLEKNKNLAKEYMV